MKNGKKYFLGLAIAVVSWAIIYNLFEIFIEKTEVFNAMNSFVSALAFGGLILTIFMQQEELSLQRSELAETRKEFQLQNQTLSKQRFENTFFNLISIPSLIASLAKRNL